MIRDGEKGERRGKWPLVSESARVDCTHTCTKFLPMTSSFEKPVSCAAFRFHSLTKPFASTPKIGAFA